MSKEKKEPAPPRTCSYLTFNIVDWVDVFIRPVYKDVIVSSLNYFVQYRGLTVYAWCLMSNHLHLVADAKDGANLAMIKKDFIKYTTKEILEAFDLEPDLRRKWILDRFEHSSQSLKRIEKYQIWQSCSNPSLIDFRQVYKLQERILYVHENPVRDKIVANPADYIYSSAIDYAGKKGLVIVKVINFDELRMSVLKNGAS